MKYDVAALGELLIDFTGGGISEQGNPLFEANPGGAPGNVLGMLAKLGRQTAFIGKVGDDMFGRMMCDTLESFGIDTKGVSVDSNVNTTLAFVQNFADGDREFAFFRKPGADTMLRTQDVDEGIVANCRVFHFGSLSLTHQPARDATLFAAEMARSNGAVISFDPNLRPLLWSDLSEAKSQIYWGCRFCDVLKISDDELCFLSEKNDVEEGIAWLQKNCPQIKLLFVTKGKAGAVGVWGEYVTEQPGFGHVTAIDTTGAGDTFCGSCLSFVLDLDLGKPDADKLRSMVLFANAAAALVTTKKGALRSMPSKEEINRILEGYEYV